MFFLVFVQALAELFRKKSAIFGAQKRTEGAFIEKTRLFVSVYQHTMLRTASLPKSISTRTVLFLFSHSAKRRLQCTVHDVFSKVAITDISATKC